MSVLLGFLVKLLIGFLGAWIAERAKTQETEKAGALAEAAKVDAAEVTAMQAILQASANAPADLDGVIKDGENGVF